MTLRLAGSLRLWNSPYGNTFRVGTTKTLATSSSNTILSKIPWVRSATHFLQPKTHSQIFKNSLRFKLAMLEKCMATGMIRIQRGWSNSMPCYPFGRTSRKPSLHGADKTPAFAPLTIDIWSFRAALIQMIENSWRLLTCTIPWRTHSSLMTSCQAWLRRAFLTDFSSSELGYTLFVATQAGQIMTKISSAWTSPICFNHLVRSNGRCFV